MMKWEPFITERCKCCHHNASNPYHEGIWNGFYSHSLREPWTHAHELQGHDESRATKGIPFLEELQEERKRHIQEQSCENP